MDPPRAAEAASLSPHVGDKGSQELDILKERGFGTALALSRIHKYVRPERGEYPSDHLPSPTFNSHSPPSPLTSRAMGVPAGPGSALATEVSVQDRNALPQYGFGPDVEFDKLVNSNPFLFRVHTPRELSPFYDRSEPYFIGPRFESDFSSSTFSSESSPSSPFRSPPAPTYADAVQHMDWTTRSTSPYVSTSFSFAWAIWEATRRYHHNMKHSVEIAIIDARAVASRAVTAVELLRKADAKE